jgi:RNA polymerase sigma-70 factor (ECF subfamily)
MTRSPAAADFIPTRGSLLSRLRSWDDEASWRDFFETYWKLIYAVSVKAGLMAHEAEEVVQETVISVAKNIGAFKYDPHTCSFKTWLLNLARWRIIDQLRKRPPSCQINLSDGSGQRDIPGSREEIADPMASELEGIWEEEWEKNLIDAAMERVKRRVKPLQYQIFDLYVFKQWPVHEIAKKLRVNIAQVYLAKHRIGSLIKKEVKRLETRGT